MDIVEVGKKDGFGTNIAAYYRGFVDFRGLSTRRAFWHAILFVMMCSVGLFVYLFFLVIGMLSEAAAPSGMGAIVVAGMFLFPVLLVLIFFPLLALFVRRLRDVGFRGPAAAVLLLAIIGLNIMYYWFYIDPLYTLYYSSGSVFDTNPFNYVVSSVFVTVVLMLMLGSLGQDVLVRNSDNGVLRFVFRTNRG